jgi:hypothetical protein
MTEPLSYQYQEFGSQQQQETLQQTNVQPFTFGGGASTVGGSPLISQRQEKNEPPQSYSQLSHDSQLQRHKPLTVSSAPRLLVAPPALLLDDSCTQDNNESARQGAIPLEQRYPDYYAQQQKRRVGIRQGTACSVLVSVLVLAGGGVLLASLVDRAAAAAIYGVGLILVLS